MHILFVAPPRDVSHALRTRNFAAIAAGRAWHPTGLPNITVYRPLKLFPNSIPPLRLLNEWLTRIQIRRANNRAGKSRPATNPSPNHQSFQSLQQPPAQSSSPAPNPVQSAGPVPVPPASPSSLPVEQPPAPSAFTAVDINTSAAKTPPPGILWINAQDAAHMAGRMGESKVIYDITDDWTKFSHFIDRPALLALTVHQDQYLCRNADHVIVCSQSLYNSRQPLARSIHLIPNGVDLGHYTAVTDSAAPLPPDASPGAWPRPVFGYTGSIHPDRVDVNLLMELARLLTSRGLPGSIVLLGPNMLPPADTQRLAATGRVLLPGPRPYADLPQYMRAFDVCITPHCMTAFVESLNPIKLWEYLAAGKPIVSTDVAGFRDFPDVVRIAANADDFLTQLQAALQEGGCHCARRRAIAADNSWQARVDQLIPLLG